MSPATASIVVAAIAFCGSLVGVWVNNRTSRRTAQNTAHIEALRVEAEAFERARESYLAALAEQEQRITRLHVDLAALRTQVNGKTTDSGHN